MTLKRFSFPKSRRLVGNRQFKAVLARHLCVGDGLFTLFIAENDCGYSRLGISVNKSCGGAVVRNRVKRLLREAFRQSPAQIPAGFDYFIIVSARSANLDESRGYKDYLRKLKFEQVRDSLLALVAAAVGKIGPRSDKNGC